MTRTRSSRTAAKSRRRFLKVVAMGSAAALVSAALPRAGEASERPVRGATKPKSAGAVRPAAIEAEIAKQKHSTAEMLKTIRDYPLPAGSEMAFAFAPVKAAKRRAAPRGARTSGGGQ
jgi:hypothetical protein